MIDFVLGINSAFSIEKKRSFGLRRKMSVSCINYEPKYNEPALSVCVFGMIYLSVLYELISLSLSTLGWVVSALQMIRAHTTYENTKYGIRRIFYDYMSICDTYNLHVHPIVFLFYGILCTHAVHFDVQIVCSLYKASGYTQNVRICA